MSKHSFKLVSNRITCSDLQSPLTLLQFSIPSRRGRCPSPHSTVSAIRQQASLQQFFENAVQLPMFVSLSFHLLIKSTPNLCSSLYFRLASRLTRLFRDHAVLSGH